MGEHARPPAAPEPKGHEPVFLLPGAVTVLVGLLVVIHLAATMVLNDEGLSQLYFWFAFWPGRLLAAGQDPAMALPLLWTPFSHAFLHGGWDHLAINACWLAIFATPIARRYGSGPMLVIFLAASFGGAVAFAATSVHTVMFLIGASGGIAGLTGAAIRFIFQPVVYAQHPQTGQRIALGRRLASIGQVFANPRSRFFTLIWLVLNAAVPLFPLLLGASLGIAWQAHLGGFLTGFFLVGAFDRRH